MIAAVAAHTPECTAADCPPDRSCRITRIQPRAASKRKQHHGQTRHRADATSEGSRPTRHQAKNQVARECHHSGYSRLPQHDAVSNPARLRNFDPGHATPQPPSDLAAAVFLMPDCEGARVSGAADRRRRLSTLPRRLARVRHDPTHADPEAPRAFLEIEIEKKPRTCRGFWRGCPLNQSMGTISKATMLMILISGFTAGPAVSL